jgi:hypothetical protein
MTVAIDPIRPLAAARANGFALDIRPAPRPASEPGWRSAVATGRDGELLGALLARTAATAGTASRAVAATWHLEKHAWYVAAATLAAILEHDAMPPLDEALLRDAEQGWPEAIAVPRSGWVSADGAGLAEGLEAHLAPLVDALARHRPAKALWRSASDRLGQAALWCARAFQDRSGACALASQALAAPTALAAPAQFELINGTPARRRVGCCLSHRCPGGITCEDCGLRSPPTRQGG